MKKKLEIEVTHENHRRRVEERFTENGFCGWSEYEILEYLLFAVYKRKDTNDIAHMLIKRFGSLKDVIEASKADLTEIPGVGNEAARYISSLGEFLRYFTKYRVYIPKKFELYDKEMESYIRNLFFEERVECSYLICLDAKCRLIRVIRHSKGVANYTGVDVGEITRMVSGCKAAKVIFAHNHPSGSKEISDADYNATNWIRSALFSVGSELIEHVIVSDDDIIYVCKQIKEEQEERLNEKTVKVYKKKK